MTSIVVAKACTLATHAHGDQKRKYTGDPYIKHPAEVVNILRHYGVNAPTILAAAYLHDVVEDTDTSFNSIDQWCGIGVAELVWWLTDLETPKHGNRQIRKELARMRYSYAPLEACLIKIADCISNTRSIAEHDKDFARVYLPEIRLLARILTRRCVKTAPMLCDELNRTLVTAEYKAGIAIITRSKKRYQTRAALSLNI